MHRAAYNSRSFRKRGINYRGNYNQQSTQNLRFGVTFALNSLETIKDLRNLWNTNTERFKWQQTAK